MRSARGLVVLTLCSAYFLCITQALAGTYWANIAGSNTPPYTSYATGAHNIQDAIDQCVALDTVRIAAGTYHPDTTILLRDSVAVIGAGRDSSFIVSANLDFLDILSLKGTSGGPGGGLTVRGCNIRGHISINSPNQDGIFLSLKKSTTNYIMDNSFYFCENGIQLGDANVVVANNYFDSCEVAVEISFSGPYDIHHNEVMGRSVGAGQTFAYGIKYLFPLLGPTRIHHNTVFTHRGAGVQASNFGDSMIIYNNLFVTGDSHALSIYCGCAGLRIENNTIIHASHDPGEVIAGISLESGSEAVLENNAFRAEIGTVDFWEGVTGGGTARFAYNSLWGFDTAANGVYGLRWEPGVDLDTAANVIADPMFTDDSTYHLQRGSPLIDAGNPEMIDLDITRSDIGWTGGLWGLLNQDYQELPPRAPDALIGYRDEDSIVLMWTENTESDLAAYRLYRSDHPGFELSENNRIAAIERPDTSYIDPIFDDGVDLYYVVTAIDTADLESPASNEVTVLSTGILDGTDNNITSETAGITLVNYPNPFNSTTVIEVIGRSDVPSAQGLRILIYNILGSRVTELTPVNVGGQIWRATWEGKDGDGSRVASGIYFIRAVYGDQSSVRKICLLR